MASFLYLRQTIMIAKQPSSERIKAFSDGVFSVVITILVLELHAPSGASWSALAELWPTAASYAASYLFIAIVWVNHHHLMRFAEFATPRLVWFNFVHLFTVSLLPFTTSWMARTDLAGIPVCLYAGTFVLVNASYVALCYEAIDRPNRSAVSPHARRLMYGRAVSTLIVFALGGILALKHPWAGFGVVVCCLMTYLRPQTGD